MAIVLGLALALQEDRAPTALPLAAGAIGTVTGAVVLVANVGTTSLLAILGVVIALTGIAHRLGGFELADRSGRRWRPGVPLGSSRSGSGRH
jgi:uncharacterized membrane protein HdeD (DUF308 family)